MITKIKKRLEKETFEPSLLGLFTNPFYFARSGLLRYITQLAPTIQGITLDIGCGNKPYQHVFKQTTQYIGIEIDTANKSQKQADYYYDGKTLPFDAQYFDSIVTNQVFEHVFNPEAFLQETHRVLKQGGHLLITVPFVWDEHEQPIDYARYSSFGLKYLLETHGYEVIQHYKSMSDIRVIFQLINGYIVKTCFTKKPYINLLLCVLLIAPFNVFGSLLALFLPNNQDLYLDNIVLARKSTH